MKPNFLFLCGCPRSGTTAIWRLLVGDERIKMGVERYGNRFYTRDFLTPEMFEKDRFFSLEEGDTFYSDLEVFNSYYSKAHVGYEDATYVGDKIPKLYNYFDRLQENFPEAKTVFIFRNIFDVAASYKARLLDENDNWNLDVSAAMKDWNASLQSALSYTGKIALVDYEKLLVKREGLEKLFAFLELDVSDNVKTTYNNLLTRSGVLEQSRARALTAMEVKEICETADFESYRTLVRAAAQ
jgi:hypothetical protein